MWTPSARASRPGSVRLLCTLASCSILWSRNEARIPTSSRNILWWEDSFRVVLVRQFHRHEARKLRCRLHFGETPFGATRQDHSVSLPGRSRISVVCVLPPQRVCHSERRKEGARSRSGHDAMLTATIPDRAAMIGGERSRGSPHSKPKAAERYVLLELQTVRACGRISLSSPRRLRPDMHPRIAIHLTRRNQINLTTAREN